VKRPLTTSSWIGVVIVAFWVLVALFGPLIAPYAVGAIVAPDSFGAVSAQFPLGSDYLGRDMLSRILYGTRYTVGLALLAALLASTAGTALGLLASVSGKWIDEIVSRALDALICIPSKIFALVMVAAFGSSVPLLLVTAALTYMPGAYRIARALAVNLCSMDYVQVARARGEGRVHIACVEILPNMIHPMLADFGLRFVFVVLLLSGLSFLGLGVQPPDADLGSLVRENVSGLGDGAPAVILPALAIATLTIGVNLLVDSAPGRAKPVANRGRSAL
jgi:peptide/nickel transport system permease protein